MEKLLENGNDLAGRLYFRKELTHNVDSVIVQELCAATRYLKSVCLRLEAHNALLLKAGEELRESLDAFVSGSAYSAENGLPWTHRIDIATKSLAAYDSALDSLSPQ